jgi:hypothetical protein
MTAQVPAIAGRGDLTVTVAPGAGRGAPACFLPATAEIEVNGDHLSVDPATANPASVADRERYPALWGATVHECAHAAHSRWRAPEGTSAAWSAAATALEESRIEARQVARRPGDRAWLRASTCQIVIRDFAAAATPPASPAEAGSAAALILAGRCGHPRAGRDRARRHGGRRRDRRGQAEPAPRSVARGARHRR